MKANQATLIDGWDRKEEPLIAFAAASFRSIYKAGWVGRYGCSFRSYSRGKRDLLSLDGSECSGFDPAKGVGLLSRY